MNTHPHECPVRFAFTFVELVIVMVIIGSIVAIAVPRFGKATDTANQKSTAANLRKLQIALDRFEAEHVGANKWNCAKNGTPTSVTVAMQLLTATEIDGSPGDASGDEAGPYLRALPANLNKGLAYIGIEVDNGSTSTCKAATPPDGLPREWNGSQCGWVLVLADGTIREKP
jgi:prepilin-type N-terminal cleavage/methylation domain-containing protein